LSQTGIKKGVTATPDVVPRARRFIYDDGYSKPLLGDFLALVFAVVYASYVTLLKVRIRRQSRVNMQLFFGLVGICNALFLWPLGVILHYAGVEKFELPSNGEAVGGILVIVSAGSPTLNRSIEFCASRY
jgi:drug/metabolite transporter (DMT)-like permease